MSHRLEIASDTPADACDLTQLNGIPANSAGKWGCSEARTVASPAHRTSRDGHDGPDVVDGLWSDARSWDAASRSTRFRAGWQPFVGIPLCRSDAVDGAAPLQLSPVTRDPDNPGLAPRVAEGDQHLAHRIGLD